nr:Gfo/Idh/MocA family oxidoreductase [uncultured Psychroserpens sp.]
MKKTVFTVGLIGALADISDAHLDAITTNPYFSLKAVCDTNEQKLQNKFNALKNVCLTTDYNTLLEDDEINTIVICTPNHLHASMTIEALKANKHVLCEKPMTISTEESTLVLKAMEASSGILVVSYHFEFFPEVQFLKQELSRFSPIKRFHFISSEHLSLTSGKEWNFVKHSGGVWLDWAPNALSVLKKIITENDNSNSFKILDAKLNSVLKLDIETNVSVKLILNHIEGELHIDWEANKGTFVAQTIFWDEKNTKITLDHATNCIYVDDKKIWNGNDSRYRDVYKDFSERITSKSSNIKSALFHNKLIDAVFKTVT